jgi:hypothetical protein
MEDVGKWVYVTVGVIALIVGFVNRDAFAAINREKRFADAETQASQLPASFSRTVGLVGLIFLTGFMWVVGLYLVTGSEMLKEISESGVFQDFLFAASALFAPYAANQISQIFGKPTSPSPTASPKESIVLTPLLPPE